ncbi:MAG: hypothetical protein FJ265_08830 [Planctomycetes bacterium]|nr:hypothetical protein [Planctomycetota bacterium]
MAFDGAGPTPRLLLHGGLYASPSTLLDETWVYAGGWQLLTPTSAMPGRWGHQLVRDTLRNRLVTFGGRSPTITAFAADTWRWTGTGWLQIQTAHAPAPRYLYGMCYDALRDRIVLYGGRTVYASPADTWEFDGTDWQQRQPANSPGPRQEMVMAHDTSRGVTVLFGGFREPTSLLLGDTWEYDGTDWLETSPPNSPSPRYRCAFAYDSRRQRIVVYGGYDGAQILDDTLEYGGSAWVVTATSGGSPHATEMYAAYDPVRTRTVTFGGVGTVFSNQTFEYLGAATAQFGPFGQGCPTSAGVPALTAAALPRLGQSCAFEVAGLPLSTGVVIVAMGLTHTTWNGSPLPQSLASFGLQGCSLAVAPDALLAAVAVGGSASFGFAVPNQASLANLSLYLQAFAPDALAPNGMGGISRAGRATLGS